MPARSNIIPTVGYREPDISGRSRCRITTTLDVEVRPAGLRVQGRYGPPSVQLTRELCEWADEVYVMEQRHVEEVVGEYGQPAEKVRCLDVEDVYGRGCPELKHLLGPKLQAVLKAAGGPNNT